MAALLICGKGPRKRIREKDMAGRSRYEGYFDGIKKKKQGKRAERPASLLKQLKELKNAGIRKGGANGQ